MESLWNHAGAKLRETKREREGFAEFESALISERVSIAAVVIFAELHVACAVVGG